MWNAARKSFAASLHSRPLLVVALLVLCLVTSALTRISLLAIDPRVLDDGVLPLAAALGVGELFDLQASLWLALPWVLYLWLLPERWYSTRVQRGLILATFVAAILGSLVFGLAESFFFEEFDGRFNFVAVDYLLYPSEVGGNIWQSYHTGLWLTAVAATGATVLFALRGPLRGAWAESLPFRRRTSWVCSYAVVLAGMSIAVPSSLAHVSDDRTLNEVAANGYRSFWDTLLGRDAPYAGWYARGDQASLKPRLAALIQGPAASPARGKVAIDNPTLRPVVPSGPERRLNVVVVLEESFGSEFVGALHPEIITRTPEFDALSREGTLLTHAYSTGNRTIRAIEATTASLPPLPGISIVRREASKDLFTLPALLRDRGYETLFVYGGRALFDGMGSYLSANGVARVVDQGDFEDECFKTAWGVADECIFDRALRELDGLETAGKPFYSLILTVSNHRPFTFPAGRITPGPGFHRRDSAVAYADYALGRFIRQARDHAFFEHTLFVLMGDHGARVYGAEEIPLASYEVPILFLAPGAVPAGLSIDTMASSLDVPPTVLGILGTPYDSKFFGQDVFAVPAAAGRAFMTHNSEIALMRGNLLAVLGLHESTTLYRYQPASHALHPVANPDAEGRQLIADAITYYAGADHLYRSGAYRVQPTEAHIAQQLPADGD